MRIADLNQRINALLLRQVTAREPLRCARAVAKTFWGLRGDRLEAVFLFWTILANVRYWHKADMTIRAANVRFQG